MSTMRHTWTEQAIRNLTPIPGRRWNITLIAWTTRDHEHKRVTYTVQGDTEALGYDAASACAARDGFWSWVWVESTEIEEG